MKLIKKLSVVLVCTSSLFLIGCAGRITPLTAQSLTTLAVYEFGKQNPKITATMRKIQPLACDMAKNPGSTVEDVVGVVENAGGVNADTKAVINVLLAIYQTSVAAVGTNQPQTHPYLEAVVCPGWAGGLDLLPGASGVTKNAIPLKVSKKLPPKWVFVQ